jgi:hypothetical protein
MTSTIIVEPPQDEATLERPAPARARRSRPLYWLAAGFGVALIGAAYVVSKNYEVVAEGQLLPYSAQVAKIRFFDTFTFYVAQERTRPLDVADAVLLSMLAGTALLALAQLQRAGARATKATWFLLVAGLGALFLAGDESLALHETIGDNLGFLSSLPGVERPDDLIFASYAIPAAVVVVVFRDVIRSSPTALRLFAVALALFVGAAMFDVAGIGVDELLEPLSSGFLLAGFIVLALEVLHDAEVVPGAARPRSG